jgi:broad specificity phosphatase PhoE
MPITEFYLIRHAESVANTQPHLVNGRTNHTPLSEVGIEQATLLGQTLLAKGIIPDEVHASPAVRTLQTAEHALKAMGLNTVPILDDDLQELAQGDWEGQDRTIVYTDAVYTAMAQQNKDFKAPNGESMNEVGARMLAWKQRVIAGKASELALRRIVVFGHGMAIRCLASTYYNWDYQQTFQSKTPNTSVSLITDTDDSWQVEYVGRPATEI